MEAVINDMAKYLTLLAISCAFTLLILYVLPTINDLICFEIILYSLTKITGSQTVVNNGLSDILFVNCVNNDNNNCLIQVFDSQYQS